MKLYRTGGHVKAADPYTDPELAAAAVTPHEAVIQLNGESHVVAMHKINVDKVELACDKKGCALIPDDGNPHNDIHVDGAKSGGHDLHGHQQHH